MRRGWFVPAALTFALIAGTAVAEARSANPGYDGSTAIMLPYTDASWLLLRGTDLRVREIDLHVIGAQAGSPSDTARWPREFGCWFVPNPDHPYVNATSIGFVDFLPEPTVNSTRNDVERDFPPNLYGQGYPAPSGTTAIVCGWDPKGYGYPDLVGGYGRAHIFYSDDGR